MQGLPQEHLVVILSEAKDLVIEALSCSVRDSSLRSE